MRIQQIQVESTAAQHVCDTAGAAERRQASHVGGAQKAQRDADEPITSDGLNGRLLVQLEDGRAQHGERPGKRHPHR